jgi:hypothetical protein
MVPKQHGVKALYCLQQMVAQQSLQQQWWNKQPARAAGAVKATSTRPRAAVSNFFMVSFFLETRGERPRHPPDGGRAPMFPRNYTRRRAAAPPRPAGFCPAAAAAAAHDSQINSGCYNGDGLTGKGRKTGSSGEKK